MKKPLAAFAGTEIEEKVQDALGELNEHNEALFQAIMHRTVLEMKYESMAEKHRNLSYIYLAFALILFAVAYIKTVTVEFAGSGGFEYLLPGFSAIISARMYKVYKDVKRSIVLNRQAIIDNSRIIGINLENEEEVAMYFSYLRAYIEELEIEARAAEDSYSIRMNDLFRS